MQVKRVIGALVETQRQVDGLSRQGLHAAGGTWTHSTTQSVGGAGAVLAFNSEIRNSGITVDATNQIFIMNTGGMFMFSLSVAFNIATSHTVYLLVNGIRTNALVTNGFTVATGQSSIFMKYLQKNHEVSFFLDPGVAVVVQANGEDALNESPILQISQVSPKFTHS